MHGFRISTAGIVHWSEMVEIKLGRNHNRCLLLTIGRGSAAVNKVVVHGVIERLEVALVFAA